MEATPRDGFLVRMADGTVKQVNPFTGTVVWTVPGRGVRPLGGALRPGRPIDSEQHEAHCAFCAKRVLETPPEKARLVRAAEHDWQTLRHLMPEALLATRAEFRRVPNLFEIVTYDYWTKNYRYTMPAARAAHRDAYLAHPAGRRHVLDRIEYRLRLAGRPEEQIARMSEAEKLALGDPFFGGGHEVVIARRHYADGAATDAELASSGSLTPEEHDQYLRFTIDGARELYLANRYVRYVVVFQNWLAPAGASFDHLHKQLVAIDERGASNEEEIRLARANPNLYNEVAANFACYRNLVFAENDHALAFAGFGHRFPTLTIYSKSERSQPWNHAPEELRGMSDLVHACHAAMGPAIPCNEEWHYKPPEADVAMPWRVHIKWRISNPAGFEGGTHIYVNTIDPETLRERMVPRLLELREQGRIAPMKIGAECDCVPNSLKYNPAVRRQATSESAFPPLSGEARAGF
jgi:galactose-1-phosphate uridylyltransferase